MFAISSRTTTSLTMEMAQVYGYDISQSAKDAKEAVQWTYFAYLVAIKTQNGAAMSIGRISNFLDIYIERDMAKVKVIRDEGGMAVDFETTGDFPKYGNDDERADEIAVWLLRTFMGKIRGCHTYRDSEPTTSTLTITSNVVYGKATGSLPDGRKAGAPLVPGTNPSYGAETNGLLASLNSVAKLPYEEALDGISSTQIINPGALGHDSGERIENLVRVLDGYFDQGAHHLNVFGKEKLEDTMEYPEKEEYANFTIRVSGYAVKFIDLTRELWFRGWTGNPVCDISKRLRYYCKRRKSLHGAGTVFSKWKELMRYTDLLLLDIKHIDERQHRILTGQSNQNILQMAQLLSDMEKRSGFVMFWYRRGMTRMNICISLRNLFRV